MGYQVKWVEEHLGVTRKALRIYEEKGLMPPMRVVSIGAMMRMISTASGQLKSFRVWVTH